MANTTDNERILHLYGDIAEGTISDITKSLIQILDNDNKKESREKGFKRKPIKIFINSFGGNVVDMWGLIDIMLGSKTPIHTYCTGYAMSAGFKIFLAGHKRYITSHTTLLYHQLSAWNVGKYQDLVEKMMHSTHLQEEIEKYVVSRTKITPKMLKENREKKVDWYIYAEEAVKLGIANKIIEKF